MTELITMSLWPRDPTVYEINTWVWLFELREKSGLYVDLASVPSTVWDRIAGRGFDAVWLMGGFATQPCQYRHGQSQREPARRI